MRSETLPGTDPELDRPSAMLRTLIFAAAFSISLAAAAVPADRSTSSAAAAVPADRSTSAQADGEATVRVSGSARLEARATRLDVAVELRGRLFDDAGRAVPRSHVRIRRYEAGGTPGALPKSVPCDPSPATHDALGFTDAPDEAVADTDAGGRFCVRWEDGFAAGRLRIVFDEGGGLLEPAQIDVDLDAEPAARLAFVPVPREVSADSPRVAFTLESRGRPAGPETTADLELLWTRNGAPTSSLGTRSLRIGDSTRFEVATRALGGPGAGELRARLEPSARNAGAANRAAGQGVEAWTKLVITATVELKAPPVISADSSGEASLELAVRSRAGPVDSGTVEALVDDRTIGVSPVEQGRSRLELGVGTRSRRVAVTLRYWPSTPFYRAGPPASLTVAVPARGGLGQVVSILALLAIAFGIAAAWRRPRHSPRAAPATKPAAPAAGVHWTAPRSNRAGWVGLVVDAHDARPIVAARIAFWTADGELCCSTSSDETGAFECAGRPGGVPPAEVRVEAPWHAGLSRPAPPAGELRVELVTRRRQLLSGLVEWARGRRGLRAAAEPTPGDVARSAEQGEEQQVVAWARAVEAAAFGPEPLDAPRERAVRDLEPEPDAGAAGRGP